MEYTSPRIWFFDDFLGNLTNGLVGKSLESQVLRDRGGQFCHQSGDFTHQCAVNVDKLWDSHEKTLNICRLSF